MDRLLGWQVKFLLLLFCLFSLMGGFVACFVHQGVGLVVLFILIVMLLLSGLGFLMMRHFVRDVITPLNDLSRSVVAVGQGDLGQKISVVGVHEISSLAEAFNTMTQELRKARRNRDNEINNLNRRLNDVRNINNALPGLICLSSQHGALKLWNKKFEIITGYTSEEVAVANLADFFPGEEPNLISSYIQDVFTRGTAAMEASMVSKLGVATPHYWLGHSIDLDGVPCMIGLGVDISEYKEMTDLLRRAKEVAEEASCFKSLFLAKMSHEIRTPMNTIVGMGYLLSQSQLTAVQQTQMGKINSAAEILLAIINDILDLSKIESGKLELEHNPFRLEEVLDKLVDLLADRASEKGIRIRAEVSSGVPSHLIGDALRLEQILLNLGSNALKFTQQGAITVGVEPVERLENAIRLRFWVRDSGIGLSGEQIAGLFRPFTQADVSTTRNYGGTGLGLTICKNLVECMGGVLNVISTPGVGSEFVFTLLFELPKQIIQNKNNIQDIPMPLPRQTEDETNRLQVRGARILVVEDHDLNWQVVAGILGKAGVQVERAVNGLEAVQRLTGHPDAFDCVLMDLNMPVMDGHEATRRIREQFSMERLPIVAMTANALKSEKEYCLALGMNDFLTKPVNVKLLFSVLAVIVAPVLARRVALASEQAASTFIMKEARVDPDVDVLALIDLDDALERLDGDRDLLTHLLIYFAKTHATTRKQLVTLMAMGDWEGLKSLLHGLKGVAANIGASLVANLADRMEQASCEHDRVGCQKIMDQLCHELEALIRAIEPLQAASDLSSVN
ncbi:MAG: ATP-binding protein [Magnetococcus sp. YQC-5]